MRTLLVDDHLLFREGLALLIAKHFPILELVEAGTLAQAMAVVSKQPVQLVLLDINLPDSQGMAGLVRLREAAPQAVVVVLSADESPDTVLAAIDHGAAGYIPKTASASALQGALHTVLAGGVSLPTGMLGSPPRALQGPTASTLGLSPRQLDVLALLIEGRPNKLICRELDLAESTVKTHLAAIFRKLEVTSRTQAVVVAARLGLRLRSTG